MRGPKRVNIEAIKQSEDMPKVADYLDKLWERQAGEQKREEKR